LSPNVGLGNKPNGPKGGGKFKRKRK
jgi:hypothetical protein